LPAPRAPRERVRRWRARLGASDDRPLVASFGHIGSEHRPALILDVIAEIADEHDLVLAVVGEADPALAERPSARRLGRRVRWTGWVDDGDFVALMCATDIAVNLRYPTARASSGSQQQLLQLGVPVVIHDLVHLRDLPEDAVRRVPTGTREGEAAALRAALTGWLTEPGARRAASESAKSWAARAITPGAMARSYVAAIAGALAASGAT